MPLFGPSNPNSQGLMSRLFGGGGVSPPQAPAAPSTTAAVAQQTGATASSPFLRYLQSNAPAAQQTAQSLMGDAPEPDYRAALIQAGLGILSQDGGQSPLQAIAKGAQTAMPLYLKERGRVKDYDAQVKSLAAKLNMGAVEFDSKMGKRTGLKEMGGYVIDQDQYEDDLKAGASADVAFENAAIINPSRADEDNAKAYGQAKMRVRLMQNDPDAPAEEVQLALDELEFWESKMKGNTPTQSVTVQDEDGRWTSVTGTMEQISKTMNVVGDQKSAKVLREKFEATDQVMDYGTQIFKIMDAAEASNVYGKLGGMASSAAVWTDAIMGSLTGARKGQFQSEVAADPMGYLDKMENDPRTRALVGDDFISSLREIGRQDAAMLSNIIGLGYATARAEEPGGRLATSDVAFSLSSSGYDMDALLNDPTRVKEGVMSLLRRNVADYERTLLARPNGEKLLENDFFLTKRLPQYGYEWTGGPNGRLLYVGSGSDDQAAKDDASTIAPIPTVQPTAPPPQAPPAVGTESDGYRFKGGDPADPNNWEQL